MSNTAKRTYVGKAMCDVIYDISKVNPSVSVIKSTEWQGILNYPLKAVFPLLDSEAQNLCFKRYEAYQKIYNINAIGQNTFIDNYNKKIDKYIEASASPTAFRAVAYNQLREHQNKLNVWEYNTMAQRQNRTDTPYRLHLRKIPLLKDEHHHLFKMIIRAYQLQIKAIREANRKLGKTTETTIPKVDINSSHLENLSHVGGGKMSRKSKTTFLRQKKRLIEAGILQDRGYRGSKKGVKYFINTSIMAITDDINQKTTISDNQIVKYVRDTFCTDINTLTSTIIQSNINDVDNSTSDIGKKSAKAENKIATDGDRFLLDKLPAVSFTSTPGVNSKQKRQTRSAKNLMATTPKNTNAAAQTNKSDHVPLENKVPAAKEKSKSQKNTHFLREQIKLAWAFCVAIGNKDTMGTPLIPLQKLNLEANAGTLDNREFNELLLQNIMLIFAKIYNLNDNYYPYHKIWKKVYDSWLTSYFFINKNGHLLDKKTVLERYRKLIFTLENKRHGVLNRIARGSFTPPSAEIFLNPYAATPGTLLHHYKKVEKHSPKVDQEILEQGQKFKEEAQQSKTYNIYKRRLFKKFALYSNGKIDDVQLITYTKENMPTALQQDFDLHWTVFINNNSKK